MDDNIQYPWERNIQLIFYDFMNLNDVVKQCLGAKIFSNSTDITWIHVVKNALQESIKISQIPAVISSNKHQVLENMWE